MDVTRREFLAVTASAAAAWGAGCRPATAAAAAPPLLANHAGFPSRGAKFILSRGAAPRAIIVRRRADDAIVGRFETAAAGSDLGVYTVADVGAIEAAGDYVASTDDGASVALSIAAAPYASTIADGIEYFRQQRCGHPTVGHNAPCHLDDGRRSDTGAPHDAAGGWHDACDLRKWVDATIYGVIGLGRGLLALGAKHPCADLAREELRWGNAYFLKMQAPDGYVMRWCAGDDGNRYTDGVRGNADDRIVDVEPAELPGQFLFMTAQALAARLHADTDPAYAATCLAAAGRCMRWCAQRSPQTALSLAAGATAACALVACGRTAERVDAAARYGEALLRLQAGGGWFRARADSAEPFRDAQHGNLPLLALCDLLETLPAHADVPRWQAALALHASQLESLARRSAFGIVPYGLYGGTNPGGDRRAGDLWYRWFMRPRGEYKDAAWWVGNSAHIGASGVGLRRAASLLSSSDVAALAQRHADWLLGVNPFDATTVTGTGRNMPRLYRAGTFAPPTPALHGGVINGVGGDALDRPLLNPGSWQTCEYWTPNVSYLHWLLSLMSH